MKLMIAIPCMDMMHVRSAEAIYNLRKPDNTDVVFLPGSLIYDSRNLLSLRAMQENYDYVLWVDSDMICHPGSLMTLLDDMNTHNTRMISGLYVKRKIPSEPVIYERVREPITDKDGHIVRDIHAYTNYPKDDVFNVEGCGFGFVLTDTSLLKNVWDKFGPAFSPFPWAGEDISFCYRVNLLGDQIMCDSRVRLGHVGSMIYTDQFLNHGGDANEK